VVEPPAAVASRTASRPLLAVLLATFFVRFGFGITLAVFDQYLTGQSVGTVGIVSALAPVGEFSTVLLSGIAADRWGRFPVLFGGMASAAVLLVVVGTTRSVATIAAANLLFGIASGAILASSLAVVADESGAGERGFEMGRFDAMNLFGWIAGYAFGLGVGSSIPSGDLGVAFLGGAGILAIGLVTASRLVGGIPLARRTRSFSIGHVLRSAFRANVLVVTLPWLAIYGFIGSALIFLPSASSGIGISPDYLAAAIAGAGTLLIVSQPYFGRLADRTGRTRMMTVGAVGFGLVMLFASLLAAYGPRWPLLAAMGVSVLAALTYGPASLAALADLAGSLSRATTMAIYSLTISLGMVIGLIASTSLFGRFGLTGLYVFFGGVTAVLAAFTAVRWWELRAATIPVR
jgi:MFS family permease